MEEEKRTPAAAEEAAETIAETAAEKTAAYTEEKTDMSADDPALESFLNREAAESKPVKMKSKSKMIFIMIAAVAAVAILVVVLLLVRSAPGVKVDEIEEPAQISLDVSKEGVHEAKVPVDKEGEIEQNGSGELLSYVPADIKRIDVENRDGSFSITAETPEGEATVYTLVGFEKFDIQKDIADEIAGHCAQLDFSRVIAAEGNLADFGLDDPAAKVKVTYTDDTTALIRVGNAAAGDAGTYVAFGDSDAVYLAETDAVKDFLYSVNSFISLDITDKEEDSDNATFTSAVISGTHYDDPISLEPNTDEAIDASYIVTWPRRMFANPVESYDIAGNIRGLYAESVLCVNPSADQLKSYGLSEPYATVKALYPDTDITLHASAPAEDGIVNIYNPDKNVIYTIQLAAVSWAKTSLELLEPENPLVVKTAYIDKLDFTAGDTSFSLDVDSNTEKVTGEDGTEQEVTTTKAVYNGEELNEDDFTTFMQNLNAIKNQGDSDAAGNRMVMSVTYSYTTDRADDTYEVYSTDASKYILKLNGEKVGTVSKAFIDKLIVGAQNLIKGEQVDAL